ncbi:MAG: hypothetical protein VB078_08625 [Clostridiaceae bacterium]|nr:hypothetical protein [Clostridiaceae bacterium]
MLKALIKVRLAELKSIILKKNTRSNGKGGKLMGVFITICFLYAAVVLCGVIGFMCYSMLPVFSSIGLQWLYHAVIALFAVAFCFMGSVFLAQSQIFDSRDNELLLSMPIPPKSIVASRLISFLLLNYLYTAIVMVPAAVVYIAYGSPTHMFYVGYILGFLTLPMLSMTITCAVAYLISLITSRMRHKNLISGIAMIVFFIGFMAIYMNMANYMMALIQNGETVARTVERVLPPFYSFGMAVQGSVMHLALALLWCILPFFAVYRLLAASFRKIATSNKGLSKIKYVSKELKSQSARSALTKKELGRIFGFPLYLFNCAIGGPMALLFAIVFLVKGTGIITSLGSVYGMGSASALVPFVILVLCFCASTTCTSAPSISLEGTYFWILRSAPISACDVFYAKIMANLILGLPPLIIASAIFAAFLPLSLAEQILLILLPMLLQVFTAMFGLIANLMMPRFDWISQAAVVKQSGSVLLTIFGGMGLIAAPALLFIFFAHKVMSFTTFGYYVCLVLVLICVALWYYLKKSGSKRFEHI